ncbi:aspartate--tRNA ligase [Malassezia vespertilionis]|uniref:Aminoacyl-transfer RNA synthetases class-II family profile domain-containing protein n=1 Tax=Malassezia vespertilionis TaxID=2020962 RepID=A0A2N1JA58_9BASI|nr:aspartate--tRNA ligase [Malassezia vespertilionis]PKI83413.1 hypothetical protein MVES_002690 [Malassezia vespertilionis]WFD07479.1 aspartate--tRNA ligase [Malassezia vespertilionis]
MRLPRQVSKQLAFVPLQDASGTIQLKLSGDDSVLEAMRSTPLESVISVRGTVQARADAVKNAKMRTGDVEVHVTDWQLLNAAEAALPFYPTQCHDTNLPKESLRARYRYLDLRRVALAENIRRRSRVAHAARCFLHSRYFTEIETPVLLRSTPEGAREFLSPTRVPQGTPPSFYALQQSPQQPKQLLMASGVTDRYFQFAKCFRDEDGRKDRQPEFTQIDVEMSFVAGADAAPWRIGGAEVRDTVEGLVHAMWDAAEMQERLPHSFPVYTYTQVMSTYGSDKPDLRFGLSIAEAARDLEAEQALDLLVLPHTTLADGSTLKLSAREISALLQRKDGTRSEIEHFKAHRNDPDALASLLLQKSRHVASVQPTVAQLRELLAPYLDAANLFAPHEPDAKLPRTIRCDVFVARRNLPVHGSSTEMGDLRLRIAETLAARYRAVYSAVPHIMWVTEFPLFTRADQEKQELVQGRWSSSHHPFTAPAAQDVPRLLDALRSAPPDATAIASIHGQHYDLVLNGMEIAGGSVRIHDPALQEAIFRSVLDLSDEETHRFAHLLHALKCGAPPHAGIAIGFDRFMAILCGTSSIRDVIAFPKSSSGADPLFASPAPLEEGPANEMTGQLAAYGLKRAT